MKPLFFQNLVSLTISYVF